MFCVQISLPHEVRGQKVADTSLTSCNLQGSWVNRVGRLIRANWKNVESCSSGLGLTEGFSTYVFLLQNLFC